MGRVRTKTVKSAARVIVEKYAGRLTLDFHTNKRICDDVAVIPTKRLRNKIAGYVTKLMRRLQNGHRIRGISTAVQEAQKEVKDVIVNPIRKPFEYPKLSILDCKFADLLQEDDSIATDPETRDMLKMMGYSLEDMGRAALGEYKRESRLWTMEMIADLRSKMNK